MSKHRPEDHIINAEIKERAVEFVNNGVFWAEFSMNNPNISKQRFIEIFDELFPTIVEVSSHPTEENIL